jgi:hypothetical protein
VKMENNDAVALPHSDDGREFRFKVDSVHAEQPMGADPLLSYSGCYS